MSKLIKKLVKQKDVETILPVKTITDMETIHPVVSMEGSTNDAPTSFMNIETGLCDKKILIIPEVDAPTSSSEIISFEGTLTPYYYSKKVFLNQIQFLFFSTFSIQLLEDHIIIHESANQISYRINLFSVSSQRLRVLNRKLQKQILLLPTEFFPIMSALETFVKDHFKSKKDLIYISQNIMKFKKDKNNTKKFQLDKDGNKIPYCSYQYHFYEKRDIQRFLNDIQTNQHLCEIIRDDIRIKPYFDTEIEGDIPHDKKFVKLQSFIFFLIQDFFELYNIQLEFSDFVILDSNTSEKLSYHLLINEKVFFFHRLDHLVYINYLWARFNNPRNESERELFDSLTWYKNGEKRFIFDNSVYSRDRAIRMVNQSKAGKNTCLKIISEGHTEIDTIIQYDTRIDFKHRICVDELTQIALEKRPRTLKTKSPKMKLNPSTEEPEKTIETETEDQTERPDVDPHANFSFTGKTLRDLHRLSDIELLSLKKDYLICLYVIPIQSNYAEWIKIGMALKKCNAPVDDWIEWSRLGESFKEGECEYYYERFQSAKDSSIETKFGKKITGYSYKTLRHLAYRSYPKLFTGFIPIYRQLYRHDLSGIEKRVQTTKYLCEAGSDTEFDYITDKRFVIIWALMGKGKSQLIHRVLENPEYKRSIYLSARQTFAFSTKGEFKDFTNYIGASSESLAESNNIIISLESLLKIPEDAVFDLVICDEIETLLMNFSSETMNRKTYEIFQRFKRLIRDSKKTFFMDAFISNRSISFVKNQSRLFRNQYSDILFLENTTVHNWVSARKIPYDESHSFPFIHHLIQEGKKLYITFGSNRKMLLMRNHFGLDGSEAECLFPLDKEFASKVLTYNKSTSSRDMENLKYINDTWKSASLVATTPKITVGCNFSPEGDSTDPEFDIKICLGVHSCTARDMFQSLMRVRNVGKDGLFYGIGFNMTNFFEKNFLTLDAFNTYEDEKRTFILEQLQQRKRERQTVESVKGKTDRCLDIDAMIQYLQENKPDSDLRSILYFNSLEYSLSSRYYKRYFEALLPLAGFQKVDEEPEENEESPPTESTSQKVQIETVKVSKKIVSDKELLDKYNEIPMIHALDKDRLEKRQMKMISNNDENMQLEKYFFLQIINADVTPIHIQALLFHKVWLEGFLRKKLLNEFYFMKDYEDVLLKETNDMKCTEKIGNIAEKISMIKDIETLIGWKHGDQKQVIKPEDLRKAGDYFKTNHDKIHKIFKLRDQSKKKKESSEEEEDEDNSRFTLYCINMINKVFKDFSGYSLFSKDVCKKTDKTSSYIMISSIPDYDFSYLFKTEKVVKKDLFSLFYE